MRRMKKNGLDSSNKYVVHLDKIWIHLMLTISKCWKDNKTDGVMKSNNAGQLWIIVHAGSERGFVPGAYLIF
jgi:hypothetical protein